MRVALVSLFAIILAGCAAVYLKHPVTGEAVTCGPYPQGISSWASARREAKCVDDFKEQGYLRVPSPD